MEGVPRKNKVWIKQQEFDRNEMRTSLGINELTWACGPGDMAFGVVLRRNSNTQNCIDQPKIILFDFPAFWKEIRSYAVQFLTNMRSKGTTKSFSTT